MFQNKIAWKNISNMICYYLLTLKFHIFINAYRYFLFSYTSERPSTCGWSISFIMAISRSTFINTDSESFSRLIILIATFLPNTQCTPSLTKPKVKKIKIFTLCRHTQKIDKTSIILYTYYWLLKPFNLYDIALWINNSNYYFICCLNIIEKFRISLLRFCDRSVEHTETPQKINEENHRYVLELLGDWIIPRGCGGM